MYRRGVLSDKMRIIGFSRRELGNEEFREMMFQRTPSDENFFRSNSPNRSDSNLSSRPTDKDYLTGNIATDTTQSKSSDWPQVESSRALTSDLPEILSHGSSSGQICAGFSTQASNFAKLISYVKGDFRKKEGYEELKKILGKRDKEWGVCANKLFYLAVPPKYYGVILDNLNASGLTKECRGVAPRRNFEGSNFVRGWTRIIIEKPFGKDLESAKALDKKLGKLFREEQIFRIDHYLGKESLQNILAFRFGNAIFEPVWNKDYIDNVQIIASERLGLEGRVTFYDLVGALRDMVQSHLLQMVAVVGMERPRDFTQESIRDERVRVLKSLQFSSEASIVCGQYEGYRSESGVSKDSQTETFAALKLFVDSKRWEGVPFYLLTGKRLKKDLTRIVVEFKRQSRKHTDGTDGNGLNRLHSNRIMFEIKPKQCISIEVNMKEPGLKMEIAPHRLQLNYGKVHGHKLLASYGRLLLDCMLGDQTLFARTDGVLASWEIIRQIRQIGQIGRIEKYKAGSWGPEGAREFIQKDGRRWYL
jgi:glucose-6-phosphate 1-dehydrogenase